MFENIMKFLKKFSKEEKKDSKTAAKERLHLVLMQDRANVSADFMELMKQEIIEVIKKYIDVDENSIDVKLTNKVNGDGTTGAPILYANIPILNVKDDTKQLNIERNQNNKEEKNEDTNSGDIKEKVQNGEEIEQTEANDTLNNNESMEETQKESQTVNTTEELKNEVEPIKEEVSNSVKN